MATILVTSQMTLVVWEGQLVKNYKGKYLSKASLDNQWLKNIYNSSFYQEAYSGLLLSIPLRTISRLGLGALGKRYYV